MSGAAIGVENRCLMKNKNNKNSSCENVNVDINYIIKDIYGYKNCKKRCIQFIEDDTICNDDIDLRKMKNKKIKVENMWYKRHDSNDMNNNNNNNNDNNNDNDSDSQHNNSNNNDVDNNTFKRYNNYNEKYEENHNMEKEVYHACSIQSRERSCVNDFSNNNNNNNYYYMTYQMNDEHIKNSNNIKIHNNVNINMSSNNVDNNDDANSMDSNDDSNNMDNSNDTHNVNNKDETNNKYNDDNHNYYHKKRNKQQPVFSSNEQEDKYVLSKKTESLMDTILFNIHSCSEMNQAKKIMLPLLNDFIQNNFYKYIKFYEDNQNSSKHNIQTLQKEKKVLISAVKIQYQKILQLQKLIENQKSDIKKKTEELNQIKAKVHQYFYDINNPNKRIFSILSPDVY
ncbi:conserved Plasmodium protein, unknown function [Plasmodium reichenowi]|uniref:Uncharacterized protein n=1 Tax=Plasmodium reichenowi TaxID=5854 RepID=A0A060S4K2_PLARE|nr:conserved Plasmodium protein, unknown function [Plasmodium reichenowi]